MGSSVETSDELKLMVFGDRDTVNAFMLAGIPGKVVGSRQEVDGLIRETEELAIAIVVKDYSPEDFSEDLPIVLTVPRRERR